jgi:hypothetical protein
MPDLKGGMRFIGSNNSRLDGVYGPMASGTIIERLPPKYWDTPKDPEWIIKYDERCGGDVKCVRESVLCRFKMFTT